MNLKNKKCELTYKDLKIGQKVTCVKNDNFTEEHITVGKEYLITDIECQFWDAICIKTNKKREMFIPIEYFADIKLIRNLKLKKLNDIK